MDLDEDEEEFFQFLGFQGLFNQKLFDLLDRWPLYGDHQQGESKR
jgi:hypothetical protein